MTEQMRKEFEAWWRREHENTLYCESAWRGWQASRAEPDREVEPWIPVREGLPQNGRVEFYSDDLRNPTDQVIGVYMGGKWFSAGIEYVNVTHWKPVTAAPKEQSDE